jgi:hypothetical protein
MYFAALVVVTGGVALVVNSAKVARGNGGTVWGWIGALAGAGTIAVWSSADVDEWIYIPVGAAEVGMGAWSIARAGSGRREAGAGRLEIGPAIARRVEGTAEARIVMTLRF